MKHLAPEYPKTRNGKALIVDDDIFVVEMIRSELQRHGIETVAAFNGIEAINSLNEEISVVILDLLMPRMGGRECHGKPAAGSESERSPISVLSPTLPSHHFRASQGTPRPADAMISF